jgi:hypothetical protein
MSPDAGLNSLNSARLIYIDKSPVAPSRAREVLGLYRKRSGAMSFEHDAKSERRSVFDRAT